MSPTSLSMLAKRYPFHLTQTITYFCSIKLKEPFNYFSVLLVTEEILLSEIYLGTLRLKPLAISPQIWQFLLVLSCTSEWFWAWIFEGSCWPLGRTFVKNGPIDPCDSSSWIQLKILQRAKRSRKKIFQKIPRWSFWLLDFTILNYNTPKSERSTAMAPFRLRRMRRISC